MTRPASATPWPGRGRRARGRSILSSTRSRRSGDLGFLIPCRACEREARGAAGPAVVVAQADVLGLPFEREFEWTGGVRGWRRPPGLRTAVRPVDGRARA